jgi:predicted GNAT family acetyltransferase
MILQDMTMPALAIAMEANFTEEMVCFGRSRKQWELHLHNRPVASASLLYHAGVAGIYGVSTIPVARRRGVAASMTLHLLRVARDTGYRVATLSPTDMSEAIYRRIGFQPYCTLLHYEWSLGE